MGVKLNVNFFQCFLLPIICSRDCICLVMIKVTSKEEIESP